MSEESSYSRAKKAFERIEAGERISCQELAERVGANNYQDKKKVAAFLSQQASRGRVKKYVGEDRKMYYEKLAAPVKPSAAQDIPSHVAPSRAVPPQDKRTDTVTFGEIGEGIVNYIQEMRGRITELQKERDETKEELTVCTQQKEEVEKLYQEAEQRIKGLSVRTPVAQRAVRLSKLLGEQD
jgi:hypothetical protein